MKYELAKELKDAGFPHDWCSAIDTEDANLCHQECFPTLSGLIEACGEKFDALFKEADGTWTAYDLELTHAGNGETPEEAVTRFWLALNKRSWIHSLLR